MKENEDEDSQDDREHEDNDQDDDHKDDEDDDHHIPEMQNVKYSIQSYTEINFYPHYKCHLWPQIYL